MNSLELKLTKLNPGLYSKLQETIAEVKLLLQEFKSNFPTYTDHSINHSEEVFNLASQLLTEEEVDNLNEDEIYILSMGCILHDIGMCIPQTRIKEFANSNDFLQHRDTNKKYTIEDYLRNIHHELSNQFILDEWVALKIPTLKYAKAIGLIAQGHRKVDLGNIEVYEPKHFIKSGREFVCLPYLASILRLADELDITNVRTPYLLTKYYMPNNDVSIREWEKHIATTQINFSDNEVIFEVTCSNQNTYAALQDQFEKIENVLNYCHKIIRNSTLTGDRRFHLNLLKIIVKYTFEGFDPKGIKFSFNVPNVIKAFIGEDLYGDELTSIREALQNSIDSCRYKKRITTKKYKPQIKVKVTNSIIAIEDNGMGMDEFIVENFFGKLGSSFYEQDNIKKNFEAIGQFGVGVFSYFLLCDFIDIETKTITGTALKFRIDKDPKSYFHFFPSVDKKNPGTTIFLNLKDEYCGKFSFSAIEKYINNIFRFIEIPIEIIDENDISTQLFKRQIFLELNSLEISKRLKLFHKSEVSNLDLFKVYLDTEEYEGECGIIINKLSSDFNFYLSSYGLFDPENFESVNSRHNRSQIAISQKGVFVNNFSSYSLSNLIGNINLKRKHKINIKRDDFIEIESIDAIIATFEVEIIERIFLEITEKLPNERLVLYSKDFLENYFRGPYPGNIYCKGLFDKVLNKYLHFKIFENGYENAMALEDIIAKFDEFILISELENKEYVYKIFSYPLIITSGNRYEGAFDSLSRIFVRMLKYTPKIVSSEKNYYQKYCRDNYSEFIEVEQKLENLAITTEVMQATSNKILVDIWSNEELYGKDEYNELMIFNSNHPFIQYIIKHYELIESNKNYKKILTSSLDYMFDICSDTEIIEKNIVKLNEMLKPLDILEKPYNFTMEDFPSPNLENH